MKINLISIGLFFFIFSCNSKSINVTPTFEAKECNSKINFLDHIQNIEFIVFDDKLIIDNSIAQMIITDSVYVFTTYSYNRLYFVSKNSLKIVQPLKYNESVPIRINGTYGIAYSENDQILYVSDRQARIFKYSMIKKEFTTVNSGILGYQMTYFQDKIILLNQDAQNGVLKIIDPQSWKIENEYIKNQEGLNFIASKNPFITSKESVLLSISGSDTIYSLSKDFKLNSVAAIGYNDSSLKSIDFKEFRTNLYKFGDEYAPDNYNIMIPEGELIHFQELLVISLVRKIRQILWNRSTNNYCLATPENLKYAYLLFENSFINVLAYKDGYYYSSTRLDGHFYAEAKNYLENHDNKISQTIQSFIDQYPEERIHENPVLVKFSLNSVPYE